MLSSRRSFLKQTVAVATCAVWTDVGAAAPTPLQTGAIGDGERGIESTDDTLALQGALDYFKRSRPKQRKRDSQRVLDLAGRRYRITAPLSLEGCDGLEIRNGTILVDRSTPFERNRAILEHDVPQAELWGFTLANVTLQGNQVANGLFISRPQELLLLNPTILGWGQREYGCRLGPVAYSADTKIIGLRASGFAESYADNPVAARNGIGIDVQTADTELIGVNSDTGKICIRIHSSTSISASHIWNGNPGAENLADANNVGVEYVDGTSSSSLVVGNTFDNCCIIIEGPPLFKQIVGNKFYSNQKQLEAGIILCATGKAQPIADFVATNNHFHGYYRRAVMIDNRRGSYVSVARSLVASNVVRSYVPGSNSFSESLSATQGSIIVPVSKSDFDRENIVYFDLGRRGLLLGSYGDALGVDVGHRVSSGNNFVSYLGSKYNSKTGILSMRFSENFTGMLKISFDQSYMSRLWSLERMK